MTFLRWYLRWLLGRSTLKAANVRVFGSDESITAPGTKRWRLTFDHTKVFGAKSSAIQSKKKLSFVYLAFHFQTWPVVSVWIPWLTASPRLLSNSSAVVNLDLLPLYVFRKFITPLQRERNYEWLKLPLGVPLADLLPSLEGLDVLKWMRRNPHIKVNLNKN